MALEKGNNLISKENLKNVTHFEFPKEYIVYDIETTGFSKYDDEILEIGALKVKNGEIIDTFESYLALPSYYKNSWGIATEVHGITREMLKGAPTAGDVLQDFINFVDDYILVGHNISSFDSGFVHEKLKHYLGQAFSNNFIDTYTLSNRYFKDLPNRKLSTMADHFKVDYTVTHRALDDCKINYQVYENIVKHIFDEGIDITGTDSKRKHSGYGISSYNPTAMETKIEVFDNKHPLYGKNCVLSGLKNKANIAQKLLDLGSTLEKSGVTKNTTLLVHGDNMGNTTKVKKALAYKEKGQDILVLSESALNNILSE